MPERLSSVPNLANAQNKSSRGAVLGGNSLESQGKRLHGGQEILLQFLEARRKGKPVVNICWDLRR